MEREYLRSTAEVSWEQNGNQSRMPEQMREMSDLQNNIIMTMVNLIETRDGTTGGHAKRACVYMSYLLKKMLYTNTYADSLNPARVELILKAAPLYDIGKIAISDMILKKPGRLSPEEFELVKTHTVVGSELIRKNLSGIANNTFLHLAANMAASHHERWDGKGYPSGLKEEEIPLCGRVAAIADVFDALVSKSYYNGQRDFHEAVRIMEESEGQFDPKMLAIFMEDKAELQRIMESNAGEHSRFVLVEDGLLNCGNRKDFYRFMLELYLDELKEKKDTIIRMMDQKDYEGLLICASSLKDTSRDVGAKQLKNLADTIVFEAQDKNNYALEKCREELEDCFRNTQKEVQEYLLREDEGA